MASSARLDELKKKFDENPRRYFAPLANEHRKSGDLDQAIALCRTHLPQQPGHISGHIVLAQALFEAGSLDESRDIFHTALGLDPENLIALRYLGDIAKESSDLETARSWYQRVLEVDPRNDEIVQLVRELDSPPPPPAEPELSEVAIEDISSFAPPPEVEESTEAFAPTPGPTAENDPRFAPLSLDELDVDETLATSAASETPNEPAAPVSESTDDAHESWSAEAPTQEISMLDDASLDPFVLDPANSAESLYDPAAPSADDFFLTELSGASAPIDGVEAERTESWSSSAPAEPTAEQPVAESEFEEGSFYLEPPPPAPDEQIHEVAEAAHREPEAVVSQSEHDAASEVEDVAGFDVLAAEYYVPAEESRRHSRPSLKAIDAIPDPMVGAAEVPQEDLGLEVMEFVPPSSTQSASPSAYTPSADAGTPAAFVTETMAELYLQQGFRNEALAVYRELLSRNPADASLRDRITQIESGSISSIGIASVSENVVESALKRQARPARSVRSFFASLAGRRAPARQDAAYADAPEQSADYAAEQSADYAAEQYVDETPAPESMSYSAPPLEPEALAAPEPISEPAPSDDRIRPMMSAAETLASYDPFAETDETSFVEPSAAVVELSVPDLMPNVARPTPARAPEAIPPMARPTPVSTSAQPATPAARPTPSSVPVPPSNQEPSSRRSLEELFPETPITARTEAAAQTLATAFGRSEPQGRPTRAASNELSLDHVFRGAPEGAPPADGGFSFDQFFSDSRASNGDTAAPAATAPETGRSNGSADAHDIEQFTAWLEGLKKK